MGVSTEELNAAFPLATTCDVALVLGARVIGELLATRRYRRVFFSSDGQGGLGTGIFAVAPAVKAYIVERLEEVVAAS